MVEHELNISIRSESDEVKLAGVMPWFFFIVSIAFHTDYYKIEGKPRDLLGDLTRTVGVGTYAREFMLKLKLVDSSG